MRESLVIGYDEHFVRVDVGDEAVLVHVAESAVSEVHIFHGKHLISLQHGP